MAKHTKKVDRKADTQKIVKLSDRKPEEKFKVTIEYEPDEAEVEEKAAKNKRIPKAVYSVAVILLVLILGLSLWVNRDSLSLDNISYWLKLQVMGDDAGDGFPVQITGSSVQDSNFSSDNDKAIILSDTALTVLNSTGKEEISLRHSLNQPHLRVQSGKYLLYNVGSTGYIVVSNDDVVANTATETAILSGAVAPKGKFALGVEGSDGATELYVFEKDGSLQYEYLFAKDYITALALNYDGSFGAVCTVRSEKGEMISKLTILDFSKTEPVYEYETTDNLLLDAYWGEDGTIYAVGDTALLTASSSNYSFTEHSYDGRQLTTYKFDANKAFISLSAYAHAGASTLHIFTGSSEPLEIEAQDRIESISVSGGVVAMLVDTDVIFCDYANGTELGRVNAESDAKAVALMSESEAYILGVSEIRTVSIR